MIDTGALPSPTDPCPDCASTFVERDLQYPSLGSTAYECEGCGTITFDVLDLDEDALSPDRARDDVGPDVQRASE